MKYLYVRPMDLHSHAPNGECEYASCVPVVVRTEADELLMLLRDIRLDLEHREDMALDPSVNLSDGLYQQLCTATDGERELPTKD